MICPRCGFDSNAEAADQLWLMKLEELILLIYGVVHEESKRSAREQADRNRQQQKERVSAKRNSRMDP